MPKGIRKKIERWKFERRIRKGPKEKRKSKKQKELEELEKRLKHWKREFIQFDLDLSYGGPKNPEHFGKLDKSYKQRANMIVEQHDKDLYSLSTKFRKLKHEEIKQLASQFWLKEIKSENYPYYWRFKPFLEKYETDK